MTRPAEPKTIRLYEDANGIRPYADWIRELRDALGRRRILRRVQRLEQGNYGDYEALGDGVYELRLFFGPGYRVYFAEQDKNSLLLLCGGTKATQKKDIERAKAFWKEHKSNA